MKVEFVMGFAWYKQRLRDWVCYYPVSSSATFSCEKKIKQIQQHWATVSGCYSERFARSTTIAVGLSTGRSWKTDCMISEWACPGRRCISCLTNWTRTAAATSASTSFCKHSGYTAQWRNTHWTRLDIMPGGLRGLGGPKPDPKIHFCVFTVIEITVIY